MPQITLDAVSAEKLHSLTQAVDLCDPSGEVLGRFTPTVKRCDATGKVRDDTGKVLGRFLPTPTQYEPVSPTLTDEELEKRFQSTEWYTTEEVLKNLERL